MEKRFNTYLNAERWTALFLMGWALVSALVAAWAYSNWGGELLRELVFAVVLLSLVQGWAGSRRWLRARRLDRALRPIVTIAPPAFVAQELPRLEKKEQSSTRRRFIELALFTMGLCFTLAGGLGISQESWLGTGIGLCLQMAVLLIITLTSQWRDGLYRNEIERELRP